MIKRQLWPVGLFCSPWPEQALRANIHCQISLALNRIYTEWYPSKGYSFNITNSTSYDQYYVHGRTVFDVMVRLTDDIFNTYIRKTGTVNPYYAEYCDGKSVTCPGLKQWGTVTLANQGRSALSILKYYYGSNIEIIRTNNIQSIPQSYPGSPLRQGSTGAAVFTLQRQLNRITKDYPFLGLLTVDGIVGRKTWDSLYGKASALRSSGPVVTLKRLPYPGTPLTVGTDSSAVLYYTLLLQRIAYYYDSVASPALSSQYTQETANATASAQELLGLPATGVADAETWTAVEALSLQLAAFTPNPDRHPGQGPDYPDRAMKEGSVGADVRLIEGWLTDRSQLYCEEDYVADNASFGPEDTAAVKDAQRRASLEPNGVVDRPTWAALRAQSHTACDNCTEEG